MYRARTCRIAFFKRHDYPWGHELKQQGWHTMKREMIAHFREKPRMDTRVNITAKLWPRFASKEMIENEGLLPARIKKYGVDRGICLPKKEMLSYAFDEDLGHLSHLFKARLYHIHIPELNLVERCVVKQVKSHVVDKELDFVSFDRHVPYEHYTEVDIPVTMIGLYGCPGALKGAQIDLAMPTIKCEVIGDYIPPPFAVDCSRLRLEQPYGKITIEDMLPLLPKDKTARFSRTYENLDAHDVIMCYDPADFPEQPLPDDWVDPNFLDKFGKRIHLTYTGFWPKQTTRS
eukprot:GEMP01057592.1.p1 GENE.GEMP01057592.1~~GEMP01057592.1.p1  ORF type:complete len:289 (+),score=53.64 GEMP01057592.1:193-1059(+)